LKDVQEAYSRREETTLFPSAIDPMGSGAESLLAEALHLNGHHEEALPFFRSANQKSPNDLRTILAFSECLAAAGKIEESLEYLSQQYMRLKKAPEIRVHLNHIKVKYGDKVCFSDSAIAPTFF
jgi:tetratricopeptide (TPR) repeat protein